MIRRRTPKAFTDGIAYVCSYKKKESSFSAVKNAKNGDDLEVICKLAFNEKSCRASDREFAESQERTLTKKIEARHCPLLKKDMGIVIDGMLYDPYNIDTDRVNQVDYLYLEKARELDGWTSG